MPFGLDFKASPIRPKFKRALNVICLMVHPQPDICNLPQYTSFKGKHALSTCTLTKTHGSNQAAGETASASAATVRDPRLHPSLPSRTRQVLPEGNICGLTSPTSCSILDIHDGSPVPQIPPRPNSPRKRDRVLKSYRHMRHRTISDVAASTRPSSLRAHIPEMQTPSFSCVTSQVIYHHLHGVKQPPTLPRIWCQDDPNACMPGTPVPHHSVLDVGGCRLFTDVSPTSPFENTRLVECESLLQILQSDSGITLDASSDLFSPPPTLWSLDSYPFPLAQPLDVSAIGPSAHSSNDSEIVPPIPRLMLTYPTPNAPESPVFVPHSPITLTKFLSASSVLEPQVFPPLPTCDKCGLAEFEAGTQCRECEEHWVTCRVWYQANDGGRRRYLMDPYIKPAESNARNRAIMDALRVPGGNPNAMGLGLQFETRGRRARAWQRCTRLVASKTTANTLDNVANPDLPLASGLVSFLKRSWTCILRFFVTGDIRIDPYHLGRINSSPKSVHHVNQTMAPSTSLSGLSRSPRQGCIQAQHTTTSPKQSFVNPRFVEFLAGHFGYFMLRP